MLTAHSKALRLAVQSDMHDMGAGITCLCLGCRSTMKWESWVVVNMQAAALVISWFATGKNLEMAPRIICEHKHVCQDLARSDKCQAVTKHATAPHAMQQPSLHHEIPGNMTGFCTRRILLPCTTCMGHPTRTEVLIRLVFSFLSVYEP